MSHDCAIGNPELLAANSVINAPEKTLVWKDKKLPLISYTFKDHINVYFVDWEGDIKSLDVQSCDISECLLVEGIHLPDENRQQFVELLRKKRDIFFQKRRKVVSVSIDTGDNQYW